MAMNLNYRNLPPRLLRHHRQADEAPLKKKNHRTRLLPPRLLKLRHQQQKLQPPDQERLQTTKTAGASISTGLPPFAATAAVEPPAATAAQQHPWPQLLYSPPQPHFHDQSLQPHPPQFLFLSAPFPPHLYMPLPQDTGRFQGFFDGFYTDSHVQGFFDGFYTDSHVAAVAAAPVPGYLYQPQDSNESCIEAFVEAVVPAAAAALSNKPGGVDQPVYESYIAEGLQRKSLHKQQQQYDQDGKKIIGEGLTILNIMHGAAFDELHVGSGSSEGGIRIPGPFKVGKEEVVLPASLDEHDTSFIVIVPKASN